MYGYVRRIRDEARGLRFVLNLWIFTDDGAAVIVGLTSWRYEATKHKARGRTKQTVSAHLLAWSPMIGETRC